MNSKSKFKDWNEVNALATKASGKFSVLVAGGLEVLSDPEHDKILKAIIKGLNELYGVKTSESNNNLLNLMNEGLYFFESEADAWSFYRIFDREPVYASVVYASIYSPTYGIIDENT